MDNSLSIFYPFKVYKQHRISLFLLEVYKIKANQHIWNDTKADAKMVGAIVALLVVITIGLLVYYEIAGSIAINNASGVTAAAAVNTTANTVFTLAPIVAIVLIASLILFYVTRFGGGGGV